MPNNASDFVFQSFFVSMMIRKSFAVPIQARTYVDMSVMCAKSTNAQDEAVKRGWWSEGWKRTKYTKLPNETRTSDNYCNEII